MPYLPVSYDLQLYWGDEMSRVTLIIGLTSRVELDCPVNSREEAEQVLASLKGKDLVKVPHLTYAKLQGETELGSKGVTYVNPEAVAYSQILGTEE
ncbi:MAG: hypothetical protein AMXMBFR61_18040 [Fimbriimonadales bacterium]